MQIVRTLIFLARSDFIAVSIPTFSTKAGEGGGSGHLLNHSSKKSGQKAAFKVLSAVCWVKEGKWLSMKTF